MITKSHYLNREISQQHELCRTIAEAILVQNAVISTVEVATLTDLQLAKIILALNGRVVVPADEANHTLH